MFKNLSTSTKLFILCAAFVISLGVPVYALVLEKQIAIDFARKELVGSRYLATVREVYAAVLSSRALGGRPDRMRAQRDAVLAALARAEADAAGRLETAGLAQALAAALRDLWASRMEGGEPDALVLDALAKAQALAARIGDDSNLALDPDLDSYYAQSVVVRSMPMFLARLSELQQAFEQSVTSASPSALRKMQLEISVGLVRATAREMRDSMAAGYRGNPDGGLKRAVGDEIAATISHLESYLGVLGASTTGIDARDGTSYSRYHAGTVDGALEAWAAVQSGLDRLLQLRIDRLVGRMWLDLALVGIFAALSMVIAALVHRRIVEPLRQLEAAASTVRQTKNYGLRAEYRSEDEIGRVASAFNDMLSELAAARDRETAERAEFARVTRFTTMGEMAASIAHEVNQPLAAIVANGNAGLRWLAGETPELDRVRTVLQRVVRDGLRASEVVASVRAMFRKGMQQKAPIAIDDLIAEVLSRLHGDLQRERISVQVEMGEGLPAVCADRVQLQQVFGNLIANGIDAMRSVHDRPRRLRVEARIVEADSMLVTLEDTGQGIDPNVKDRIFDPFFTTKSGGMGLGLSICRSIVEAHGGRVWASPGDPHGTVFQLVLPCDTGSAGVPA